MTPGHDRPARRVHQYRAGPAQGLGDERALAAGPVLPQHGRMELHELHVPQFRAGPGGQGQAVAGQPGRVGGGRVGLAEAAGGQHDRGRGHRADLQDPVLADDPGQDPADRAAVVTGHPGQHTTLPGHWSLVAGQGVQHDTVGQHLDPAGQQGGAEHPVHLPADRVAPGADDPVAAVPALQVQRGRAPAGPRARPGGRSRRAPRRPASPRPPDRTGPRPRRACPAGAAPGCPPDRWRRPGPPGPAASHPRRSRPC